ncbi:MFS transporter [Chachezhania sediminis]|uniref:MFS transporter n=1 Tax=Chachezhania sediminis TaxID=2599291 RepID=UPI00131CFD31|nr:MFS transporter [Chachezhania sediminis]
MTDQTAGGLPDAPYPGFWTRANIAGAIGNTLEWYDFAIYGYLAPIIAAQFFPSDDKTVSLIATFGVFAAGFMMRPIGGIFFGHIADRHGRKLALTLSVGMMAIPTTLIAFLPGYAAIGVAAPLLLTLLRLCQGLSVGGEYTSSATFLVEHAPIGRRGLAGSWAVTGAIVGLLLGSAVADLMSNMLAPDAMKSWGWRVPFLMGILLGFAGVFLRRNVEETFSAPELEDLSGNVDTMGQVPLIDAFRNHGRDIARVVGICVFSAISFYGGFVYLVTYLEEYTKVSQAVALDFNTASLLLLVILLPVAAHISDKVGRKPMLLTGTILMGLGSYPIFWLLHHPSSTMIMAGEVITVTLIAIFAGCLPATMCELFPGRVRVTAVSVSYNIPYAVFGGTAPMVATWLIGASHDDLAPAFYVSAAAAITLVALLTLRETSRLPLR